MNNRQSRTAFGKSGLTVGQFMLKILSEQPSKRRSDTEILRILQAEFGRSYQTESNRIVAYWVSRYNLGSLPGQDAIPAEKVYRYDDSGKEFLRKAGPIPKAERGKLYDCTKGVKTVSKRRYSQV